jgi:hypothetical protein
MFLHIGKKNHTVILIIKVPPETEIIFTTHTSESFCIERIFFFEGMIFKDKDKIIIRERNTKQITILIDVSAT